MEYHVMTCIRVLNISLFCNQINHSNIKISSSVTYETFVDETRVWRKYTISNQVSMMNLFKTTGSMPLFVEFLFPRVSQAQ